MNDDDPVLCAFREDTDPGFERLMRDRSRVFWVKWSERDEKILAMCEAVLKTGGLAATRDEQRLTLRYNDRVGTLELADEPGDRHRALLALNAVLAPDFEVRFLWDSSGADAGAFLPLGRDAWRAVEAAAGERLRFRVMPITPAPNIFTELTPNMRPARPPGLEAREAVRPWWKLWG